MTRILKSPAYTYEVTILKSAAETNDTYSLLEVNIFHGGGNEMHYHTHFTEHFELVSGVLSVQVRNKILKLQPGDTYTVDPYIPHRFFNDSGASAVFRCTITPARSFEKCLRVSYGLANDGLVNRKGIPRKFWHLVVLFDLGESYLQGPPLWLQKLIFGGLARIARWMKVDRKLMRYCEETSVDVQNSSLFSG